MERKERAVDYKHNGCNCCQAVLLAFADELGLSADELKRIGAAFGTGMGSMEATCGALCGAQIVDGMRMYKGKPMLPVAREMMAAFTEKCGASVCKELKGIETGVVLCSCDDCVRNAVEVAERICFPDVP